MLKKELNKFVLLLSSDNHLQVKNRVITMSNPEISTLYLKEAFNLLKL